MSESRHGVAPALSVPVRSRPAPRGAEAAVDATAHARDASGLGNLAFARSARGRGMGDAPPDDAIGNQALLALLDAGGAQAQLEGVSTPSDPAEREADVVAERVSRGGACAAGGCAPAAPCSECKRKAQREAPASRASEPMRPIVTAALGPGRPLDGGVRARLGAELAHDFANVRVHTGARADRSARAIGARAYTVGSDVVFRQGAYEPGTSEGTKLLAHELTHVVQQASGAVSPARIHRQEELSIPNAGEGKPLASTGPLEQKAPEVAGDPITIDGVLLTTDKDFDLYQIEQYIAQHGLDGAGSLVERLAESITSTTAAVTTSQRVRSEQEKYGAGEVSGVPLDTASEEALNKKAARAQAVLPIAKDAFAQLKQQCEEVLGRFAKIANDKMYEALAASQARVLSEARQYGIPPSALDIDQRELHIEAFPQAKTAWDVAHPGAPPLDDAARWRGADPARKEMIAAAMELRNKHLLIDQLEKKVADERDTASRRYPGFGQYVEGVALKVPQMQLYEAKQDYNKLLTERARKFPILVAFSKSSDELGKLTSVTDTKSEDLATVLLGQINEKLRNIRETRENMDSGAITPWSIPLVVEGTRRVMQVDRGTMYARAIEDRVKQAQKEKEDEKKEVKEALGIVSFALTLVAAIPTPLSPILGAGAAAIDLGVALYDLRDYVQTQQMLEAAAGTDFDPALSLALSQEEPSLMWLAVELVLAGVGATVAARSVRGIGQLRRAVIAGEEGAVDALRNGSKALNLTDQQVARIVGEAESAKAAAGKAGQVISEDAIKAGKLADSSFEYGGHTYQVLKDGRLVRCSPKCVTLELLYGDLLKEQPHLAEELKAVRAATGKDAAEAFSQFSQRMDRIRKAQALSPAELEAEIAKFPPGSQAAEDLRFTRYKSQGGELDFGAWADSQQGVKLTPGSKFKSVDPEGNPIDSLKGLSEKQEAFYRAKIDEAERIADPATRTDEALKARFERYKARMANREPPAKEWDFETWKKNNPQLREEVQRGVQVEPDAVKAIGGTPKRVTHTFFDAETGKEVTTVTDGIRGKDVVESKYMGTSEVLYDSPQLRAQRDLARELHGKHEIVMSADSVEGLTLKPPVPRPSATVGRNSVVTFFDPKQGKITHTWNSALERWVP